MGRNRMKLEHGQGLVSRPFLLIPPFPGATVSAFEPVRAYDVAPVEIVAALRRERVGGAYWAAASDVPDAKAGEPAPDEEQTAP